VNYRPMITSRFLVAGEYGPITIEQDIREILHPWYTGTKKDFWALAGNWFFYRKNPE
jgi:hypothetical protein